MRGLYSCSREYRTTFRGIYFPNILQNSWGNSFGATCCACICAHANTGKNAGRLFVDWFRATVHTWWSFHIFYVSSADRGQRRGRKSLSHLLFWGSKTAPFTTTPIWAGEGAKHIWGPREQCHFAPVQPQRAPVPSGVAPVQSTLRLRGHLPRVPEKRFAPSSDHFSHFPCS